MTQRVDGPDIQHMKACAEAATPGEWHACGHDRGGCVCGQVWSKDADAPVAKADSGNWGDSYPSLEIEPTTSIEGKVTISAVMKHITYGSIAKEAGIANAAHIAASSPANVLALIDAVDDFRIAAEASDAALVDACENLTECRAALAAAEQRVKELEDGLRPFGRSIMPHQSEPDHWPAFGQRAGEGQPTCGDIRRAAALLAEAQKEGTSDA